MWEVVFLVDIAQLGSDVYLVCKEVMVECCLMLGPRQEDNLPENLGLQCLKLLVGHFQTEGRSGG